MIGKIPVRKCKCCENTIYIQFCCSFFFYLTLQIISNKLEQVRYHSSDMRWNLLPLMSNIRIAVARNMSFDIKFCYAFALVSLMIRIRTNLIILTCFVCARVAMLWTVVTNSIKITNPFQRECNFISNAKLALTLKMWFNRSVYLWKCRLK